MEYITAKEAADKWGISARRVQVLCEQNRVEGAVRLGWAWAIPRDAGKPHDKRTKESKRSKKNGETENVQNNFSRRSTILQK